MARTNKPCYYCGAPSVSVEHGPPRSIFKGWACDSITAPSCEKHNSAKSGHDQAVVSALLMPLAGCDDRFPLEPDVQAAIEHARPSFQYAKRSALDVPLLKDPPEMMPRLPNVSYLLPSVNIKAWVKQLTATVVWNALQKRDSTISWDEVAAWSAEWIESDDSSSLSMADAVAVGKEKQVLKAKLEDLSWAEGWSAHPRPYPAVIYRFWLHFKPQEVVFKHRFYNQYSWYACVSGVSDATADALHSKLPIKGTA
jgi:hypothetical protein